MNPLSIMGFISDTLTRFFPSEVDKEKVQAALLEIEQKLPLAQISVNQEEAKSRSLFVAGWRPAVGWVCVLALFYEYIIRPILALMGFAPLNLDSNALYSLLMGMLGLGGMRTYEKVKGLTK